MASGTIRTPTFLRAEAKYLKLSCGTFCALSLWEGWGEGQVLRIMIGLLPRQHNRVLPVLCLWPTREIYGVVLRDASFEVDMEATQALRRTRLGNTTSNPA